MLPVPSAVSVLSELNSAWTQTASSTALQLSVLCNWQLSSLHHLVLCHVTDVVKEVAQHKALPSRQRGGKVYRYKPGRGRGRDCFLLLVKSEGFLGRSQSPAPAFL